jgi:hypothetical protein
MSASIEGTKNVWFSRHFIVSLKQNQVKGGET